MPRKHSLAPSADYDRDWQFALALSAFLDALPPEDTTRIGEGQADGTIVWREVPNIHISLAESLASSRAAAESRGRRIPHAGLKMALQDLLEVSRDLTNEQISQADAHMAALKLPTVTSMRLKVWQTIPKVIKRGRIRDDTEYYLLVERLNDVDDEELPSEERTRLEAMVEAYGQRKRRKGPPAA